jgi:hypothetical protein
LQALQSCLKVLQNLRATIVRGLSRHEAHDSDLKLEPDDTRAQAATEAHVTWKVENVEDSSGTEQAHKGEEREERDGSKEAGDKCEGQMQDILALTSVTLANMALQNLRIFRCHEALCVAQVSQDSDSANKTIMTDTMTLFWFCTARGGHGAQCHAA